MEIKITTKIKEFNKYLEIEKGYSLLTIRSYKYYLLRLNSWLKDMKIEATLKNITPINVKKFRIYLAKKKLSLKTQSYHAIAIRSFLRWLIRNDFEVMAPDKIELPRLEERSIIIINSRQTDQLLEAPNSKKNVGKRDKAILEMLFSTGLRVGELIKLNRTISLEGELSVNGKGGRNRVVFLSDRAIISLKEYLESRIDNYKPLFIRYAGKENVKDGGEKMRLTTTSIERMIKKYSQKINLPVDVTPHTLRHLFATDLLNAGADIRSVQEMLGHKSIASTQIYTHITNPQLKNTYDKFHGKSV